MSSNGKEERAKALSLPLVENRNLQSRRVTNAAPFSGGAKIAAITAMPHNTLEFGPRARPADLTSAAKCVHC